MRILFFAFSLILSACATVQAPLIDAFIIDTSACAIPSVAFTVSADGTQKAYVGKEITPGLLEEIKKLPKEKISGYSVPCENTATHPIKNHNVCGTRDFADDEPWLWRQSHCAKTSWKQ